MKLSELQSQQPQAGASAAPGLKLSTLPQEQQSDPIAATISKPVHSWTADDLAPLKEQGENAGLGFAGGGLAKAATPAVAGAARAFAPPLGSVGARATLGPIGDMLRTSITDGLAKLNKGQATQFESALAKHGIDPYTDPASSLAPKIFKKGDGDVVALLQRLSGGADWVENQAGAYAATKLHEITEGTKLWETHARNAAKWAAQNADWIHEVPKVEEAVQKYISGLRRMAIAKGAAAVGAASAGVPSSLHRLIP